MPGPGQYSIDRSRQPGPNYGFGSSTRSQHNSSSKLVPGPGMYFDDSKNRIGKDAPMVSMKFRPQSAGGNQSMTAFMPGPGAYNPNDGAVRHQSPVSRIGTGKRSGEGSKLQRDLPGPGTHEIGYDWKRLSKHAGFGSSLRGETSSSKITGSVPGPGNYNP